MKKLRAHTGETLPETLVSLLIVVLIFLFLSGAVISAARVNAGIQNESVAFQADQKGSVSMTVEINMGNSEKKQVAVTRYQSENGYVYYQ